MNYINNHRPFILILIFGLLTTPELLAQYKRPSTVVPGSTADKIFDNADRIHRESRTPAYKPYTPPATNYRNNRSSSTYPSNSNTYPSSSNSPAPKKTAAELEWESLRTKSSRPVTSYGYDSVYFYDEAAGRYLGGYSLGSPSGDSYKSFTNTLPVIILSDPHGFMQKHRVSSSPKYEKNYNYIYFVHFGTTTNVGTLFKKYPAIDFTNKSNGSILQIIDKDIQAQSEARKIAIQKENDERTRKFNEQQVYRNAAPYSTVSFSPYPDEKYTAYKLNVPVNDITFIAYPRKPAFSDGNNDLIWVVWSMGSAIYHKFEYYDTYNESDLKPVHLQKPANYKFTPLDYVKEVEKRVALKSGIFTNQLVADYLSLIKNIKPYSPVFIYQESNHPTFLYGYKLDVNSKDSIFIAVDQMMHRVNNKKWWIILYDLKNKPGSIDSKAIWEFDHQKSMSVSSNEWLRAVQSNLNVLSNAINYHLYTAPVVEEQNKKIAAAKEAEQKLAADKRNAVIEKIKTATPNSVFSTDEFLNNKPVFKLDIAAKDSFFVVDKSISGADTTVNSYTVYLIKKNYGKEEAEIHSTLFSCNYYVRTKYSRLKSLTDEDLSNMVKIETLVKNKIGKTNFLIPPLGFYESARLVVPGGNDTKQNDWLFKTTKTDGFGVFESADIVYTGDIRGGRLRGGDPIRGLAEGYGIAKMRNGFSFSGYFSGSDPKAGKLTMPDGSVSLKFYSYMNGYINTMLITNRGEIIALTGDYQSGNVFILNENRDLFMGQYPGNGDGIQLLRNGDFYEGEFFDRKMDGKGVYHYNNGKIIEGEFKNGLPNDVADVFIPGKRYYRAVFKNGVEQRVLKEFPLSQAKRFADKVFPSGEKYKGIIEPGDRLKSGKLVAKNLDTLFGNFEGGFYVGGRITLKRSGEVLATHYTPKDMDSDKFSFSIIIYPDGSVFFGKNDKSQAIRVFPNGDCQVGTIYCYKNGDLFIKRNQTSGIYIDAAKNEKYDGGFKDGVRDGEGTIYWADGTYRKVKYEMGQLMPK